MMKLPKIQSGFIALCMALMLAALPDAAEAAARPFSMRFTANTNGNLVQTGNTIMVCSGTCTAINNTSNMIDFDGDTDPSTSKSSSADITIPSGSTVLWAGLYWSAEAPTATPTGQVLFKTPTSFGYSSLRASQLDTGVSMGNRPNAYGGYVEVTSLVSAGGSGTYWVANMETTPGNSTGTYGGWSLVVAYSNNKEALNNITVFDGWQNVINATGITINVSGFLTPLSGPVVSRIGLVGWDGDDGAAGGIYTGDSFAVNGTNIYDNCNPSSNDFFNSTICNLGVPNAARYPRPGNGYTAGMTNTLGTDVDLVQLANGTIPNGATSASLKFTTTGEYFGAHAVAFVTNLYVPIVTPNVVKTATDVNGGDLMIGDTLRYTISLSNTGQDTATNLVVSDNIPQYTTYVPNSLQILTGPNAGAKTDGAGDDQAEYIATGTPRVVFRLGSGADASTGGDLPFYNPPPAQTSLSFDVTINSGIPSGTALSNSADISLQGQTLPGNTYTTTSSAAVAYVLTPAELTKSFVPATIEAGAVSQLRIVVSNPASNPASINGVTFSDTYPAGLINATPSNPAINCTSGSVAGTLSGGVAGGNTIGLATGATLAVGGSCTITVNVTAAAAGNYSNTTSVPTSTNAGNGATSNAVLSVGKPSITKAFATNPVLAGASSRLTLTVNNGLASNLTGISFTDTYPSGLVNAAVPNAATTCGGSVTATAGAGFVFLSGGSVASTSTCIVSVDVTSNTAGIYANTSGGVSSNESGAAGSGSNTASLTVVGAPQAAISFSPISTRINLDSQLTITISNPNSTTALTGVSFTDTYPSGLLNTATPNTTLNCTSGSTATLVGGAASGNTLGISGGSLAAGGSCTVTVNVSSATAGSYLNSTGPIASANGGTGAAATSTLVVSNLTAPTAAKVFAPATIASGGTSVLTITLSNANAGAAITNASVTDTYPLNVVNAASPSASTTCGGSLTANAGGNSVALSGGTIPAGGNCTVTVSVTSNSPGTYNNSIPAGGVTSGNAGSNAAAVSAVLTVLVPPTISKSFTPNAVAVNTNSQLTIVVSNPNTATALTGVNFTDTYPANITNNGGVVSSTCTTGGAVGTVTGTTGAGSLSRTGTTIAANGSCTITINVRASAAGTYVNTTGAVAATGPIALTGGTASATLSVGKPSITKAFATSPINTGGTSVMTITLTNSTGTAMTSAAFTDTYPSGVMLNAATPAASTTCTGGTVTAVAGGGSVALSGGTIPANGSCTVTVTVTATGTSVNTIPAGGLTVAGPASNDVAATATLTVNPAPVASKSFSPSSMAKGAISTLSITVQNNNNATMTGVVFTDNYPSGLVNDVTPAVSVTPATCTGTLTAAAGGNSFALTGGSIPLNTACIYSVNVTTPTEGSYVNSTGAVSSTNYGIGAAASATLTVTPSSPTILKSFSPATINAGDTSVMTITLTNPNTATAITGAAFTDVYPSGLVNTNNASAATTCVGTVSAADNGSSLQLANATIPANSSCTVTVNVTSSIGGSYTNSTGTVTTTNANNGTAATGVLTVIGPPTVTKSFGTTPIAIGGSSLITITLTNPNAGTALSSIAFTDTYPTGMTNTTVAGGTCTGTKTAAIGGNTLALSGGSLAPGASCTVTVTVTSNVSGDLTNTLSSVSSSAGTSGASASATLSVLYPPTVTKAFSVSSAALNTNVTLTVTLTNPNSTALTGVAFTDTYPTNLVNNTATAAGTCAGTKTATIGATSSLRITGGTIPANSSCTVTATTVRSATAGGYTNTLGVGSVTTTNGGSNDVAASASISVGGLGVAKAFAATSVSVNQSTTLTITITNNNGIARAIAFTDTYPAGLVNTNPAVIGGTCTGTRTAANGGNSIAFTSTANLAINGSCTVTTTVTSATAGSYVNTIPVGGVTSATAPAISNTVAATSALTVMAPPTVSKSFSPAYIGLGGSSTMTITLTNPNATDITGAAFTDTYPALLTNNGSLVNNCGGTVTAGSGSPNNLVLAGGTIPAGGSCTISISTTSATAGNYGNTLAAGDVTTANAGSNTSAATANLSVQAAPSITFLKSVAVFWDPVNLSVNPKNIPGAIAEYTLFASNAGGPADVDTISITDAIPANTALYVNDINGAGSGPVLFVDGSTSSTLTYTFGALGNMSDDLDFSTNNGATWTTATPVPGADGCDPSINKIRINPKGTFVGNVPQPSFQLKFRVCVQ
ncbi:MAG: DUF11 domain-containing protein [Sideroxydans sp.]|nr:DUF11 domain-containing protein [Sideroxydans sp.]